VEVEDGLPGSGPDVHHDPVVIEIGDLRGLRDELEHPFGLVRREGANITKRVHVALRQHEEVSVRLRVDVADGDESVGCVDVVAVENKAAEKAIRQRESPPR
jgi:hypothetical protein